MSRPLLLLPLLCLVAFSAMVSVSSCNNAGCVDNHSAIPQAGFYSYPSQKAIMLDSVEIGGIGAPDSALLVTPGQKIATLNLPFRYDRTDVAFFIRYVPQHLADTISFTYSSDPFFASEECGAMYVYTIKGYASTHNLIDSVGVTDSLVSNVGRERIRIFFRTAEPSDTAKASSRL